MRVASAGSPGVGYSALRAAKEVSSAFVMGPRVGCASPPADASAVPNDDEVCLSAKSNKVKVANRPTGKAICPGRANDGMRVGPCISGIGVRARTKGRVRGVWRWRRLAVALSHQCSSLDSNCSAFRSK